MIPALFAVLRAIWQRPAARNAFLAVAAAAILAAAVWGYLARLETNAAAAALQQVEKNQSKVIRDAIQKSKPGPRPATDEFLECLRRGGAGCL